MNTKILLAALVVAIAALAWWLMQHKQAYNPDEFLVNAVTVPATPVDIPIAPVGNTISVQLGVRDTIDEPDDTPWTLCGTIAGTPLKSAEHDGLSYDVLGSLDPAEQDVELRQNLNDDSIVFPQGGSIEDLKSFACAAPGTDNLYFYYMTSRVVEKCDAESLQIMQSDQATEKKTIALGEVRCIDPTNPPPPKEAGLERSEGIPVPESGGEVPAGFEYVGPQTIEIGDTGEFIDRGYQDYGNPPDSF